MADPFGLAALPPHVRAADFGHVLVLVDYRTGRVQGLLPAAAECFRKAARTGRSDLLPSRLAAHLLTSGLLRPSPVAGPWPVVRAFTASASWGSAEHPAGAARPAPVAPGMLLGATAALIAVAAVKAGGTRRPEPPAWRSPAPPCCCWPPDASVSPGAMASPPIRCDCMPGCRLRTAHRWKSRLPPAPTPPFSLSEPAISASPEPTVWVRDETCGLGPYRADLVESYWRWEQDPAVLVGYGRQQPESLEARAEGLALQLRGDNIRFTVYDLAGRLPVPVGVATLLPDHAVRTAEYVVMLAPEARGRGLGTAATRLTLDYAFHVTNLRMVWLKVLAPNKAGIRAYEKAGFRAAGALREAGYWLGRVCDELVMDALAGEFTGPSAVTALLPGGAGSGGG